MNTFNSSFKNGEFFYQAGSVITHKPWGKPTFLNVEKLLDEIKAFCDYDMYLVGGVANGKIGNTWDIDIIVNGLIVYQEFENTLHEIYDLALNKHNLLVDVRWIDKPVEKLSELVEGDRSEVYKSVRFGYYLKKIGADVSEINLFNNGKKLTDYLVERDISFPTEKCLNNSNNYIKI